jgi:transposase
MRSMLRFVGLDVHKHVLQVCIIDAKGKVLFKQRLENFDRQKLLAFARRWWAIGRRSATASTACWRCAC